MLIKSLISIEEFKKIFNIRLFDSSIEKLLTNISTKPERYIGIFRATKPKAKLIQNLSQALEIKFGDATEEIIEKFFEKSGYKLHDKKIDLDENKNLCIDQLFEDTETNTIYFIEQKIRDDHDSTKKISQFLNFTKKYEEISRIYSLHNKRIISIMWFIDDSFKKNKSYYLKELSKETLENNDEFHLAYGSEIFKKVKFKINFWDQYIYLLKLWKKSIPDLPELNLDLKANETLEELKKISITIIRRIFENDELVKNIVPILFPTGESLKLYNNFCELSDNKRKNSNKSLINNYLESINKKNEEI